jgi:hypothetical protein
MILYKYVGLSAAEAIVSKNSIGFSQPKYFNDPFELTAAPKLPAKHDPFGLRSTFKEDIRKFSTAILTLTRNPLNPLMWAHYGASHEGVVFGFDITEEMFSSERKNLVPVQHGNVIYANTKPMSQLIRPRGHKIIVGGEYEYRAELHEYLQRLFLYKPSCWSYEEEVRVVKGIGEIKKNSDLPSGKFETITVENRPLHLLSLVPGSIREVYFGLRSSLLDDDIELSRFKKDIEKVHSDVKYYRCSEDSISWTLRKDDC